MGAAEGDPGRWDSRPRCARCEEIIGVYEPLVHLVGGVARRTSRAAEPEIVHARPVYHATCWDLDGTTEP